MKSYRLTKRMADKERSPELRWIVKMYKKESGISEMADVTAVTNENLVAAKSSIRDMDKAKEAMQSLKNIIMFRPSEALLAQTSNLPQDAPQLIE